MSQEGKIPSELSEWIVRSLDGTIPDEQFVRLDHEIAINEAARDYYLEFIATYVGLVDLVGALPRAETLMAADPASGVEEPGTPRRTSSGIVEYPAPKAPGNKDTGALRVEPGISEQDRIREIERYAHQQLAAFLDREHADQVQRPAAAEGWDFQTGIDTVARAARWFAATGARLVKTAAVCLLALSVLAIVGLSIHANRTLGVLVDSANAQWAVPVDQTGRLRAGRMTLEEGYARVRLKKGAEVILQAPSTFDLRTTNRMFLESGWITALVPPSATGFTVKTPTSSVTDFGTEFGLLVGEASRAEIHVFDGRVALDCVGNPGTPQARQQLAKNDVVTIDAAGRTRRGVLQDRPRLFSRTMPAANGFGIPGKRLSLADMVGAGNGLDTGLWGQGIDASAGLITSSRKILKGDDNGFRSMPSLPFIDGVFVPDSTDGAAVITSTGIRFEQCPTTCGKSYEAIVNGATFQVGSSGEVHYGRLAGRTYDTLTSSSLGIHPNAGITFDLDAIRSAMPDASIRRFYARCGVSENVVRFAQRDADPNTIEVTFWVLVDGRPEFSKTLRVVPAQSEQIDVPIGARNRFLTLATTTPDEYRYCWALFAEPALELTRKKP
jgi:hypothetical protein